MYKPDLAVNNPQWLICQNTKPNQTKPNLKQEQYKQFYKMQYTMKYEISNGQDSKNSKSRKQQNAKKIWWLTPPP